MVTREEHRLRKEKKNELIQALPKIFKDKAEAEFAFSLLGKVVSILKIEDSKDIRFPFTFSPNIPSFGISLDSRFTILKFDKSKYYTSCMVEMALRADQKGSDEDYIYINPDKWSYEYDIRIYKFPIEYFYTHGDELVKNSNIVINYIASINKKPRTLPSNLSRDEEEKKALQDLFLNIFSDSRELNEVLQGLKENKPTIQQQYTLDQCSDDTCFDIDVLERWVRTINRKKQAIFYGPPGTGKTYMAEQIARHLVGGGDGLVGLIQLHPAYSYEDFIQGIRPQSRKDGGLEYPLAPGRFYQFCKDIEQCHDKCVLIIDEINRTDLARVFGELLYLLEHRGKRIPLVGGGDFGIPDNLLIIGTMNTADRSVALVDHALRRRFAFIPLEPNYGVLSRYHQKRNTGFPIDRLVSVLKFLNQEINDPHYLVGISYFLREDLNQYIEDIWKMEIEPYLDEYYFDHPENVEIFRWENVRSKIFQ